MERSTDLLHKNTQYQNQSSIIQIQSFEQVIVFVGSWGSDVFLLFLFFLFFRYNIKIATWQSNPWFFLDRLSWDFKWDFFPFDKGGNWTVHVVSEKMLDSFPVSDDHIPHFEFF